MKKKINKRKNSLFSKLSKNSLKVILSFAMALTSIIGVNPNSVFNVAADSQDYDAGSVGQLSAVKFTQATAGQLGAIALDQSGAVWSWGYNINGRLGLGLTSTQQNYAGGMRRLPYFVDNGIEVVQVQSGYETNYALDSDGYVYTWGRGNEGQMGNGNTNNNNPTPLRVPGLPKIKEIVAGKGGQQHHILALDVNGKIWGWGYNAGNRIGLTNSGPAYHSTPSEVNVPDSVKFARIEVGDNHNIALDEDGGVWTWGHNTGGSLGNGSNTGTVDKPTKINIPSGVKAIDISASFNSSLVLDENHTVWQFGRVYGRTGGTGHAVSVNTPEAVQIKASEINEMGYTPIPQKIFAGESVSYFIDQHGRSWSWGSGRYNGFGREGGFITSQLQMESQAVQLPKVFGDGDTQNYDYNPKTPADGAQKNRGGNYGGYGFNQLHPTIYDDKYKDKPEDDIWKDLALKPLPKVRQIISSRSSYTMLDEDGNIMKWGYDGSGAVAWGWDYDPKYDQNGSLKTGLYDRYTYEVMFMRGAPQIAPIKLEISDTLEKIYKKEDNSQTDKVEITAEIPASYHSDSLNITIKPELQYMKYVVIPYDPTNTDFSQQDISKEVFDALYDSGKYEVGTLIDSVIESTDKKQIIKKELEISDNSRVIVMIGDKAYGRQLHTIAKHTADNFYTPTELMHEGVGVVDTVEEQLYDGTTDNVVKTNTDHDPTQYGIPLDVNGNVIASPKFGYDTVDISKYAVLPNNEDIYWNFKSGQVSPVSFNLDDVKFKLNEKFTHKFLYERNPENWITLSYDSEVLSTGDPVTGFVMPNDNPETVKKFIEIKRTPPTIEPYQLIGYRFDGGAINDLDDGNFVHTPLASANITFVYDVAEISGNKGVTDSDGDGVASPGETLHYTITAQNESDFKAKGISIKDTLTDVLPYIDDATSVVVTIDNGGVISTHSLDDLINGITVDIDALGVATATFSVDIIKTLDVTTVTKIKNISFVDDKKPEVEIPTGKSNVVLNKEVKDASGDNFASPGETLQYIITVLNDGTAKANAVIVKDTLSEVLPYVKDTSAVNVVVNNNGVETTHSVQNLIDGIGVDVLAGKNVTITFEVVVKDDLDVKNITKIANKATAGDEEIEIEIPTGKPEVKSNKTVADENNDGFASPGEKLTYNLTAENLGNVEAKNIVIKDTLDHVLPYIDQSNVSVILNNGGVVSVHTIDEVKNGLTVNIEAGAKVSVTFTVTVKNDLDVTTVTTIANKATIGDDEPEIEIPTGKPEVKSNKEVKDASGDNFASPGETLNYVITAENKGAVKAENVTIQDKLDNVLPHVEDTSSVVVTLNNNGAVSTHSVKDLIDGISVDIEAGAKVSVSFAVVVKANLDVATVTKISNKATVGETTPEIEIPTGDTDVLSAKEVNDASGDNFASPGETLNYVITAENKGAVKAENVTIQDKLDNVLPHVEDTSAVVVTLNNNGTISTHSVQDLIDGISVDIEAGAKVSVSFAVVVKTDLDVTTVTTISNKATVGETTPEIEIPTGKPEVKSNKEVKDASGDNFASPGETLNYVITAENKGTVKAENVTIQDKLDNVLPHVEDTSSVVVTLNNNGAVSTHSVQDLIDGISVDIEAGAKVSVSFAVVVKADLDVTTVTTISNKATVGEDEPEIEIPTGKPEVKSNKEVEDTDGDNFASPGETLSYVITAENKGAVKAENVTIQDKLDNVLPHVEDTSAVVVTLNNNGAVSTHSVQDLIDGISVDIEAGAKVSVSFAVVVKADLDVTTVTTISNKATVGETTPEIEIPTGKPEVKSNKEVNDASGDNFASPGETLNYVITAENKGAVKAENVTIQDKLDNVLPHVEDTSSVVVTLNNNGAVSTHSVQDLIDGISVDIEAGAKVSVSFAVVVKADLDVTTVTTISNKATVGETTPEIEIPTGDTDLLTAKEVKDENNDNFASPGETLSYEITAKNIGSVKAENVVIQDKLDNVLPHVEDTSAVVVTLDNNGTISTHSVQDLIDGISVDIEAGAKVSVSFAVVVKADLDVTTVTTISNKATVGKTTPEIEIPTGKPEVKSNKEVNDASGDNFASPGETLNYVITAENKGAVKAENVTIQDKLDNVLPHVEDTSSVVVTLNNNGTISTHSVQDLIDGISVDIEAGAKVSVSFAVVVKADLDVTTVTTISNKATVGETTPEIEIPTGKPEVKSNKEVNDASGDNFASPGETLNYVITAENKGAVKAENVTIQDKLDNVLPHVEDTSSINVIVNNDGIQSIYSVQDLIDGISVDIEAGAKISVSFAVVVKADLDVTTVTTISNKATVGDDEPEIEIPTGKPEVKSNKEVNDASGDNFASPGETLNYVITAENKGAVKAENVTIQDKLDNVLPHVEDTSAVVVTLNNNGAVSTHSVQDLINGISVDIEPSTKVVVNFEVVVKADLDVTTVTTISNKATVGETTPEIEIPTGKPEVKSNKEVNDASGDNFASPGETLNYVITAENKGAVKAENVMIQDKLENVLPHVEDTSFVLVKINNNGVISTYTIQDLIDGINVDIEAGAKAVASFSVVVKYDLDVTTVTTISNKATVGDTTPEIEIPTGSTNINASKEVIDANRDGFASPGETLTYIITAKSTSTIANEPTLVKDTLENVLPYVNDPMQNDVTVNIDGVISTYKISDLINGFTIQLDKNSVAVISFNVVVKENLDVSTVDKIANKAVIGEKNPSVEIPVDNYDVKATKNVTDENGDGKVQLGEVLTYEIVAKNEGSVTANDYLIQDTLENVLPYVENPNSNTVIIDYGSSQDVVSVQDLIDGLKLDINGKSTVSIKFSVQVKTDLNLEDVKSIVNKAVVGNDTPSIEIPFAEVDIWADKAVFDQNGDGYVEGGEILDYVITAKNNGTQPVKNLVIKDEMKEVINSVEDITNITAQVEYRGEVKEVNIQDIIHGITVDLNSSEDIQIRFKVKALNNLDNIKQINNIATIGDKEVEASIEVKAKSILPQTGMGNDRIVISSAIVVIGAAMALISRKGKKDENE